MSEFMQRKRRSFFRKFDVDKDGFLTKEDFELIADRFCEEESPDSPKRAEARKKYVQFYVMFESAGGNPGRVTENEWVGAMTKLLLDPEFETQLEAVARLCFEILDSDGDRIIDEQDYTRFFYNLQVPDHVIMAKKAFKALDTNGDGQLSLDECHDALFDYWFSEDETRPGTLFLGPLI